MCWISILLITYILLDYISLVKPQDNLEMAEDGDDYQLYNKAMEPLLGLDYYNGGGEDRAESRELRMSDSEIPNANEKKDLANPDNIVVLDSMDVRNYRAELEGGNRADILGINPHYYQPEAYPDFGRRFVLQYPYKEVAIKNKDIKEADKLTPKLAPPELVLAVAKESAALAAAEPINPTDELIRKDILRTGDYWNAVWKEDADPQILRLKNDKKLETVRAEIPPGSELYNIALKLREISPTLLYVINEATK